MKKIFTLFLLLVAAVQGWAFEQDKYYTINRNGETGSYIYAADGIMQVGALNADNGVYVWQFIPTGKADCYYIKNVATDTYIQSSNITLSTNVQLGNAPVEYYVSRGAGTTGSGTTYFLASNDQGTINYNDDATLGLNKGATGVVAYYVKTGRGNSYWEIKEASYNTTAPEPPADEDPDVCSAIAAYRIPCGTYSAKTRLSQVDITGDGVLTELHYKPSTTGRYTLYTQERAELMHEGKVKVAAKLVGASEAGLVVTVWADFDGDGVFETSTKPTLGELIEAEFTVPAGKATNGRFRIRVDQSGGESPNADFYGTMYDLPFTLGAVQTQRTLKVSANATGRGTVSIKGSSALEMNVDLGAEVTVVAEVKNGFYFHGWRKGRTFVSYKPEYTTTMTENKSLVAVFATVEGEVEVEEMPEPDTETTYQLSANPLSATDLMQKTSPTYIAIKNVTEFNHAWFVGNKVAPSYSQDQFDENAIFVWEPVEEGNAGNYYLKKLDNTYMQTSAPIYYGEKNDAAQFTAVTPIHGSGGNTVFGDDSNILSYVIDGYEDLSLVRFVNNAGKWINVQRHNDDANRSDVTPLYNTGSGGYTYYYVYEVKEVTGYTANITDAKYSTMYTSYNVTLPEGLSAYMVDGLKEGDNSRVNLVEIDREAVIPAFTPLILYAETKGRYVLPYTDGEATVNTSSNLLRGTLDKTLVMEDGYVLSNPLSTGIGLYLAEKNKNNNQAFVNNGGKAYLPASAIPANSAVQGFKFGDFTSTAIEGVVTDNESAKVIYDLSGRRLNNITNAGVYIINGKKVMVK